VAQVTAEQLAPISRKAYQQLADAVDAHCPVRDIFAQATPIERTIAVPA